MVFFSNVAVGQSPKGGPQEKAPSAGTYNPGNDILHHVLDGYEFHFFEVGKFRAAIPLPVILYAKGRGWSVFIASRLEDSAVYDGYRMVEGKIVPVASDGTYDPHVKVYDFSLTRNVVQMFLALGILVWIMTSVAGQYKKNGFKAAPSGMQSLMEPIIVFVRDEIAVPNLGKDAPRYMPLLLTLFFFILINALFGLIPGTANVMGNIAVTGGLALVTFITMMFSSNRQYWLHMVWPPGVPVAVKPILIVVEIMSNLVVKPGALMIRLFANMVAGHFVILSFIATVFIFGQLNQFAGWAFSPISVAFCVFIYLLEILVAFIQSYIFAVLTAVFIGQCMEGAHDHEVHGDEVVI